MNANHVSAVAIRRLFATNKPRNCGGHTEQLKCGYVFCFPIEILFLAQIEI